MLTEPLHELERAAVDQAVEDHRVAGPELFEAGADGRHPGGDGHAVPRVFEPADDLLELLDVGVIFARVEVSRAGIEGTVLVERGDGRTGVTRLRPRMKAARHRIHRSLTLPRR